MLKIATAIIRHKVLILALSANAERSYAGPLTSSKTYHDLPAIVAVTR